MARLTFDWQPMDAADIADAAEAATWSRLRIVIAEPGGERVLTRALALSARTTRDHVLDTVLPLADWLARCWLHLFALAGPPTTDDARWNFERSHCLRYASEGGPLPDLTVQRESSRNVLLRWQADPWPPAHARLQFLDTGEVRLDVEEFERSVRDFVDGVLERLCALAPGHWRTAELESLWRAATEDQTESRALSACALRHGWWAELDDGDRFALRGLATGADWAFAEAVLAAHPGDSLDAVGARAAALAAASHSASTATAAWTAVRAALGERDRARPNGVPPWVLGWARAELARAYLGGEADQPETLAQVLGAARTLGAPGPGEQSAVAWAPGRSPVTTALVSRSAAGRRFDAACGLYPMLFLGRSKQASAAVLARGVTRGVHSEARAFATELVAPAARVREMLDGRDEDEAVMEVARELGAPVGCVFHQVENWRVDGEFVG